MEKVMHATARRLFEAAKKVRPDIETPADLARALNQSEQTINNWSYRGSGVSKQGRLLAQKELGISATWIEDGTGTMLTSEAMPISAVAKYALPADQGNVLVWEHPEDLPPDDNRVWLDTYDYRFSAGTGLIQWEVRQKKALPFDIGFFRALGSKPKDCKLVRVHGDSMEPYLFDRDMIMVDTAKNIIRDGKVYAIYFADEPLVKQIFKEAGGAITLHSINSGKYPDKTISPEHLDSVSIMGEVIYRSGSGWAGGN
ncbi:S24 family peptidase [Burkholderia multivorans]|uniref:S24 family peptidase n=1 Tax=Burkholderia multivorans TaxID=87883 RepID=UPI0020B3D554|nr:S24 family peptidase [Burkholderia multivorans]